MKQRLSAAIAGLALLLVIGACSPALTPTTFEVVLTGAQEVPPTGSTTATGTANVSVAGNRMAIDGAWEGFDIVDPGAHVHGPAAMGANAGILFEFVYDNQTRTFEGTFTLDQEQMSFFLDNQLYINLHSAAFPGGEIRGQITPP